MDSFRFDPFPTLKTDRLVLRKLDQKDAAIIFDYQSNKENFPFVDMPIYTSMYEAHQYIEKMNAGVESNRWIIWAIAESATDNILGTVSIWNLTTNPRKGELGYGLFPGNTGKGFMSEALKKVVEYGLDNMGLSAIEAYTHADNEKSLALLEKHHFSKVSTVTEPNSVGESVDMAVYWLEA
ncbi:MAG: GNAT family N-acetyltransferase [Bacillota bacterium]